MVGACPKISLPETVIIRAKQQFAGRPTANGRWVAAAGRWRGATSHQRRAGVLCMMGGGRETLQTSWTGGRRCRQRRSAARRVDEAEAETGHHVRGIMRGGRAAPTCPFCFCRVEVALSAGAGTAGGASGGQESAGRAGRHSDGSEGRGRHRRRAAGGQPMQHHAGRRGASGSAAAPGGPSHVAASAALRGARSGAALQAL